MDFFDVLGDGTSSVFDVSGALSGLLTNMYQQAIPALGHSLASAVLTGNLSASSLARGMANRIEQSAFRKYFAGPAQQATNSLVAGVLPVSDTHMQSAASPRRLSQSASFSMQPTETQIAAMILTALSGGKRNL